MSLKVGSKVFYPTHGAGWIKNKKKIKFDGDEKEYYQFDLINSQLEISTPVGNLEELGIRPVLTSTEIKDKIKVLKKNPRKDPKNKDFNDLVSIFDELHEQADIEAKIEIIQYCNFVKKKREEDGRLIPVTIEKELDKAVMDIVGEIAVSANIKLSTAAKQFMEVTGVEDIDIKDIKEMEELREKRAKEDK
jgi:RNA polymerase-interacting CarD/CdnL/TRCF family regulator